jgi:hypothetical protein
MTPHALAVCAAAAAVYLAAASVARQWEDALEAATRQAGIRLYAQAAPSAAPAHLGRPIPPGSRRLDNGAYQKISTGVDGYDVEYGFVNFNRDALAVSLHISRRDIGLSVQEFGVSESEMDRLSSEYKRTADALYREAVETNTSQARYEAAAERLEQEFRERHDEYLRSRGMRILPDRSIYVDMAGVVQRNTARLTPLAQRVDRLARERGYGDEDVIGAVTAMLQTSIIYRQPPIAEGDRVIAGLWPPLESLSRGAGDCDTKSAIMAATLMNFDGIRAVGVGVPGHYLMGIYRIPRKRDFYVEYDGLPYVLVEPVGPAWAPMGMVAPNSIKLLQAGNGVFIDPFVRGRAGAAKASREEE